jgi:hypothetical protein
MRRKHHSERDQLALFRALPRNLAPRDARDLIADPSFSLAKTRRIVPINFRVGAIGDWQRRAVSPAFLQKPNTHFTNSNANCSQFKLQGAAA